MKFSPLILAALVSTAAAARPKCRPKSPGGSSSSSPVVSSSSNSSQAPTVGVPVAVSPTAAPSTSAGNSSAPSPVPSESSSSASSSAASLSESASSAPPSSSSDATTSPSEAPTAAPSLAPSPSASAAPAPIPSGNSNAAATNPNYTPPKTADEDRFLDPNVKPTLPAPIGKQPTVDSVVFPPGSVGIGPDTVPASDPIAQLFVSRFNEWRSVWGAPPVQWNQTLSEGAIDHAKKCVYQHFMPPGIHGQVMDTMGGEVKATDFAWQAKHTIDRWMVEGKEYNYNTNGANNGKDVGHFTIISDPRYTQVGCGWGKCGYIYCDFTRDFPKEWEEKLPEYKEHVYPRIEVPWDDYSVSFWQRK
ncbi:uncharacterized protein LOC62_01G001681 [Vanrija pseudolonga]|uniref:SCP domain-containing protein n=1 Tax=Vanrija pseudolonga TaxID=143232 RepID=A0AAF0Y791_9TREE|nr:hypothetical protein LOC62_01G001681 [Vanrija pseudolonga]